MLKANDYLICSTPMLLREVLAWREIHDGLLQEAPGKGPLKRVGYGVPPDGQPPHLWRGPLLPFESMTAFRQSTLYRPVDAPVRVTAYHTSFDPKWIEFLATLTALCQRPDFQPGNSDGCSFSTGYCASLWTGRLLTVPGAYPSPYGIPNVHEAQIDAKYEGTDDQALERYLQHVLKWRRASDDDRKVIAKEAPKFRHFECPMDEQIYRNCVKAMTEHVRPVGRKLFLDSNPGAALFRAGDPQTVKYVIAALSNYIIAGIVRGCEYVLSPKHLWKYARAVMHEVTRFRGQADNAKLKAGHIVPKERTIYSCSGYGVPMPRLRAMDSTSGKRLMIMQRVRLVQMYAQIMAYVMYVVFNWFMWGSYDRYPGVLHPRNPEDLVSPEKGYPIVVISDIGNHDLKVLDRMLWIIGEEIGLKTSPLFGRLISRSYFATVSHWDDRPEYPTGYHVAGDWTEDKPTVSHALGSGHPGVTFTVHVDGLHADLSLLWRMGESNGSLEDARSYLAGLPLTPRIKAFGPVGIRIPAIVKGENTKKAFAAERRAEAILFADSLESNCHPNWETGLSDKLLGLIRKTAEENLLNAGGAKDAVREDAHSVTSFMRGLVTQATYIVLNSMPTVEDATQYIDDLGRIILNAVWAERHRESALFLKLWPQLNRRNPLAGEGRELIDVASKANFRVAYYDLFEGLRLEMPDDPYALLAALNKAAPRYIFDPGDDRVWMYLKGTYGPNLQDELHLHNAIFNSSVTRTRPNEYVATSHLEDITAHQDTILRAF